MPQFVGEGHARRHALEKAVQQVIHRRGAVADINLTALERTQQIFSSFLTHEKALVTAPTCQPQLLLAGSQSSLQLVYPGLDFRGKLPFHS